MNKIRQFTSRRQVLKLLGVEFTQERDKLLKAYIAEERVMAFERGRVESSIKDRERRKAALELLRLYINYVGECEGCSFLGKSLDESAEFSDAQRRTLRALANNELIQD